MQAILILAFHIRVRRIIHHYADTEISIKRIKKGGKGTPGFKRNSIFRPSSPKQQAIDQRTSEAREDDYNTAPGAVHSCRDYLLVRGVKECIRSAPNP